MTRYSFAQAGSFTAKRQVRKLMLRWTLIFLVIAVVAAAFGFGGVAAVATDFARILFFVFLVLLVGSVVLGIFRGW